MAQEDVADRAAKGSRPSRVGTRILVSVTVVLAVAVLVGGGLLTGASIAPAFRAHQAASASEPVSEPTESTSAASTPEPDTTPHPATCGDLFSPGYRDSMLNNNSLELDRRSRMAAPWIPGVVTSDAVLTQFLHALERIDCSWVTTDPEAETFPVLLTSVMWANDSQIEVVKYRLKDANYDCAEEFEGLRCRTSATYGETKYSESHFVRDGLWFCVFWTGTGPSGYTEDIVKNLWGDA